MNSKPKKASKQATVPTIVISAKKTIKTPESERVVMQIIDATTMLSRAQMRMASIGFPVVTTQVQCSCWHAIPVSILRRYEICSGCGKVYRNIDDQLTYTGVTINEEFLDSILSKHEPEDN